jgi:hypothetical protein
MTNNPFNPLQKSVDSTPQNMADNRGAMTNNQYLGIWSAPVAYAVRRDGIPSYGKPKFSSTDNPLNPFQKSVDSVPPLQRLDKSHTMKYNFA